MDWTQTKTVAEANLETLASKASNPKVALSALEKKITAEVDKVEAHLVALDSRVNALPGLLDEADKQVAKVDQIIAKAKAEGRADLAQAAAGKRAKTLADRQALEAELNGIDGEMTIADEWLTKLQDKLVEVQVRIDRTPDVAKPAAPVAAAPAPAAKPAPAAPAKPAPAAAKPAAGGKKDALDDEFASLLSELDVDLSKVELPKKRTPLPDSDDGIPDLVTVPDNELPDGEELPPLEQPKKGAAPAAKAAPVKGGAAAKAPAPAAAAGPRPTVPAPGKAAVAAPAAKPAEEPKKGSKAWLWITSGVVIVGGGGAAVAHFVFGWF